MERFFVVLSFGLFSMFCAPAEAQSGLPGNMDCGAPPKTPCSEIPWLEDNLLAPVEGEFVGDGLLSDLFGDGEFVGDIRAEARADLCGTQITNCQIGSEDEYQSGDSVRGCQQIGTFNSNSQSPTGTLYGCGDNQGTDRWQSYYVRVFLRGYVRVQ
jgi:hypothetical protein